MHRSKKNISVLLALMIVSEIAWAQQLSLPRYSPSMSNVALLENSPIQAMSVGSFGVDANVKPTVDDGLSVGMTWVIVSPIEKSFAQYLRDAVITELTIARKYDADSTLVLSGWLQKNDLDSMGPAGGELAMRFEVKRGGTLIFNKELAVDAVWELPFGSAAQYGMLAQYADLYYRLLRKLYSDPEFQRACADAQ